MIPMEDVKAGDEYNADIRNVLKLLTRVGEVRREECAIVTDTALVVGVICLLYFDVCFPSVPKDASGVKDYGASLRICPGILGCGNIAKFWYNFQSVIFT